MVGSKLFRLNPQFLNSFPNKSVISLFLNSLYTNNTQYTEPFYIKQIIVKFYKQIQHFEAHNKIIYLEILSIKPVFSVHSQLDWSAARSFPNKRTILLRLPHAVELKISQNFGTKFHMDNLFIISKRISSAHTSLFHTGLVV